MNITEMLENYFTEISVMIFSRETHAKIQNDQYKTVRGVVPTRGTHCLYIEVRT